MTENQPHNTTPKPTKEDIAKMVSDGRVELSEDEIAECVICKNEIRKGAKKCIKCSSFQHPIRRFFSGINVQALVALVPIVALAFVFVKDQIIVHKSDLRVAILEWENDRIRVVASNLGDRAAILRQQATFVFVVDGKADPRPRLLRKDPKSPMTPVIKPGKTVIVDYLPVTRDGKKTHLDICPPGSKQCEYEVTFNVLAFDHKPYQVRISCVFLSR